MTPKAPRKILVLELWGLGDLTFSTVLIRKAVEAGDTVHVLGKPHAKPLLERTFPSLKFFPFHAGWTKFIHKYRVWNWNWEAFFSLLSQLRREHYDIAVSGRDDPRDHLIMWLIGARRRVGPAHRGSSIFLTDSVKQSHGPFQHRVEDWRDLAAVAGYSETAETSPKLSHTAYRSIRIDEALKGNALPVMVIHTGARIAVRRWPLHFFEELIARLRKTFAFYLVLIPDPDGYGAELASQANTVLNDVTLAELVDIMGRASLVLCNDSGPGHLAAACNRPTITLFGPTETRWFRPWGSWHHVILRDICPHRPCFDYCRFPEPYCITRLTPATIWPEVEAHIRRLAADEAIPATIIPANKPLPPKPLVAVIVATYRRPAELARLLCSLEPTDIPLAIVVVDNADDPETAEVVETSQRKFEVIRIVPGRNLGCGGGLALAEKEALKRFGNQITHFWIMDDDAVAAPGALEKLLMALSDEEAFAAHPMVLDEEGRIGAFPGLLRRREFNAIRKKWVRTPAEYQERFGLGVVPFSWATGISLLVERGAMEAVGFHRNDFLVRGEDLDFSLRLTAWGKGVFVPDAHVQHLPPTTGVSAGGLVAERHKHAILLQNVAYISTRLVHGRRILRNLAGNYWRYFRMWRLAGVREAVSSFWRGAVRGIPAGRNSDAAPTKVVVFAHVPPPHHGQSFMVKLMLDGFGGDVRGAAGPGTSPVACYHVDSRLSTGMDDIGAMRLGKVLLLARYCLDAIWCRFRYGVRTFYFVPAPGKRCALYRDWIVMALCRPFFPRLVLHWHASGVGEYLDREGTWLERKLTRLLLGAPELSIPLAAASSADARWVRSKKTVIVPNGIPDPCPNFEEHLLARRKARIEERRGATRGDPVEFRLFYIAHCTRDKGLFDALEGVALFNRAQTRWKAHFTIAGAFMDPDEEKEFHERIQKPDLAGSVTYIGFAAGEIKKRLFEESDCLCFPTYYLAESFPLTLVEAAAYGLPSVVTRWRAIPEIQPPDYPGFVDPKTPQQIAAALECLAVADFAETLRQRFLACFSEKGYVTGIAKALSQ